MKLRYNQKLKHAISFAFVLISLSVNGCQDSVDNKKESEDILKHQSIKQDRDDQKKPAEALMDRVLTRRTDDLSEKWKTVRVLVSYSKTNFFEAGGQIKGLEAELMRQYEKYLRKRAPQKGSKINVTFIAQPFKELIPALIDGRGDIAAAGLTITSERQKQVDFTDPYIRNIDEIIVAAQSVTGLEHKADLSGRKIHVVSGSSYIQHLKELNHQFAQDGLKQIEIIDASENLESEDLMQMVNAGIFELTVVDNHIAKLWSKVLKNVILREDLKIHSGGNIAWAVRKNNPRLLSNLNTFLRKHREGTLLGNMLIKRYYEKTKWIENPLEKAEKERLKKLGAFFRKYANMYEFDWLKIAALAYQESRFDQEKKSGRGAVGVMQIKPDTAADPNVNIKDVFKLENNIHAGVKYLAFLRDRYFDDAAIDTNAKVNFTLAAYNAGPARIASLRLKASENGLDQNKWFFNVEYVAQKEIGAETVQYVANVNKYYIAYKSMGAAWKKRRIEKDKLK
jgi:membrane-bound lytic murein transglycosylase MltF